MTNNGAVNLSIENGIATIEFSHPKGNSLPGAILRQLADTIYAVNTQENAKVIVIKSLGNGAFCAGASFDELISIQDFEEGKYFFMGFAMVLNAMRSSSKLIIARIHGKAVGGGVGIAAAADYTIAHESASIKLSELALGIGPFVVGPAVERKIGTSSFSALSVDARSWYPASWAEKHGLFNAVHSNIENLDAHVHQLATELMESSPEAMKELKSVMWQGTQHWETLLEQRAEISGRLVLSDFTRNFIRAFKEKDRR